ncbi:MAG: alpha/beta fold hydrolase, partial [Gemmatimonadaceae bacterium]
QMEGFATRFVEMILRVQPAGPYRLVGYSRGGNLAYEVAAQLIGRNHRVEFLGVIDTPLGVGRGQPGQPDDDHASPEELDEYERALLDDPSMDPAQRSRLFRGIVYGRIGAQYFPQPLPIPLFLYIATDEDRPDPYIGWESRFPRAAIRVTRLAGKHGSIMRRPNVFELGRALSGALREASEARLGSGVVDHAPLLLLERGARRGRPLFCVPGAGDNVTAFRDLVPALGSTRAIHAFQPRGLDGATVPHVTVGAAADCYLRAMDEMARTGPFDLLGHSFGGRVAFEMALRLADTRGMPTTLTMVDSDPPDDPSIRIHEYGNTSVFLSLVAALELSAEKSLEISADDAARLKHPEQIVLLHERLVRVGLVSARSDPAMLLGPYHAYAACRRAAYTPRTAYDGLVRLVLVDDPTADAAENARRHAETVAAWRRWAPRVEYVHGPGNHMTAMRAPHVQMLATLLGRSADGH